MPIRYGVFSPGYDKRSIYKKGNNHNNNGDDDEKNVTPFILLRKTTREIELKKGLGEKGLKAQSLGCVVSPWWGGGVADDLCRKDEVGVYTCHQHPGEYGGGVVGGGSDGGERL